MSASAEVNVRVIADLTQFEAALRHVGESVAAFRLDAPPPPWQPQRWYATSERSPR